MLKIATQKQKHAIEYQGATFFVMPNTKEEDFKLIEKHTLRKKPKGASSKSEYSEKIDIVNLYADKIDMQIIGWEGIDGDPPCNTESKRSLALLKENEHICTFLIDEIESIGQDIEKAKEEEIKN
jgi:hypothetical protein